LSRSYLAAHGELGVDNLSEKGAFGQKLSESPNPVYENEFLTKLQDFICMLTVVEDPQDFMQILDTFLTEISCKSIKVFKNMSKSSDTKLFAQWVFEDEKITKSVIKQENIDPEVLKTLFTDPMRIIHIPEGTKFRNSILMPVKIKKIALRIDFDKSLDKTNVSHDLLSFLNKLITLWFHNSAQKFDLNDSKGTELLPELLNSRQLEIFELIRSGCTNKSIAIKLGYSESLIKAEASKIYSTLGISSRNKIVNGKILN
jgi:DNA-binding CsgD family transcriptional regulator